jgi:hypothetical protein
LNSGFIGELVTGCALALSLMLEVDIDDDAGRRTESANAWEVPVAADTDDTRDGAGDTPGATAGTASSL